MAPRVLRFRLSRSELLPDLLHEFGLHDEVVASSPDGVTLVVESNDTAPCAWEVRATVRAFDESAVEL